MKTIQILCLAVLFLAGCYPLQEPTVNSEAAIINDAFMDIVDTVAYRYHSLRPAPNFDVYNDKDSLNVAIAPVLSNIREWKITIDSIKDATAEDRKRIEILFEKSKIDSGQLQLPLNLVKKTGRYKLFPHTKRGGTIDTLSAVGKVLFSRVYFDDAYAILVATIRDQIRVGVVKLFLLEKTKMGWRKKEEYVLEVW
jgi:hypothetical protein